MRTRVQIHRTDSKLESVAFIYSPERQMSETAAGHLWISWKAEVTPTLGRKFSKQVSLI